MEPTVRPVRQRPRLTVALVLGGVAAALLLRAALLHGENVDTVFFTRWLDFDVICAYLAYKLVRLRRPQGPLPAAAFGVVLFAPTVVANSSYWGQVDSEWTAGLLACVYFHVRQHDQRQQQRERR